MADLPPNILRLIAQRWPWGSIEDYRQVPSSGLAQTASRATSADLLAYQGRAMMPPSQMGILAGSLDIPGAVDRDALAYARRVMGGGNGR